LPPTTTTTTLPPVPPGVVITAPASGVEVRQGDAIGFSAVADDPTEGDLSAGLIWSSDLDGDFGSGASFSYAGLSFGAHLITARVTDAEGATGSASVTVVIDASGAPPVVTVGSPPRRLGLLGDPNPVLLGGRERSRDGRRFEHVALGVSEGRGARHGTDVQPLGPFARQAHRHRDRVGPGWEAGYCDHELPHPQVSAGPTPLEGERGQRLISGPCECCALGRSAAETRLKDLQWRRYASSIEWSPLGNNEGVHRKVLSTFSESLFRGRAGWRPKGEPSVRNPERRLVWHSTCFGLPRVPWRTPCLPGPGRPCSPRFCSAGPSPRLRRARS
jgi:hypothetical protein